MRPTSVRWRRFAFSLIECLVVIAAFATLASLLLTSFQEVREAANRAKCSRNLKQIDLASQSADAQYGKLPPGMEGYPLAYPDYATAAMPAPSTATGGSTAGDVQPDRAWGTAGCGPRPR